MKLLRAALFMLGLTASGCLANGEPGDDDSSVELAAESAAKKQMLSRVVLARLYQHASFTLTDAGYSAKEAGKQLARLHPTYVSGMLRLDKDDPIVDDVIRNYDLARQEVRAGTGHPVRFDVVLNATDYQTAEELIGRMSRIRDAFVERHLDVPEVWFFDFYSQGKPAVLEAAIHWAHGKKQLVGGNFWGGSYFPAKSDFLALDDHDELDHMFEQAKNLRERHPEIPLVVHIENNPQNPTTGHGPNARNYGFLWMLPFHPKCMADKNATVEGQPCTDGWSFARRKEHLQKQASHQNDIGYSVMYPVFFPLIPVGADAMKAYDAPNEGDMIGFIDGLMATKR